MRAAMQKVRILQMKGKTLREIVPRTIALHKVIPRMIVLQETVLRRIVQHRVIRQGIILRETVLHRIQEIRIRDSKGGTHARTH